MLGFVRDGVAFVHDYWVEEYSKPKKDAQLVPSPQQLNSSGKTQS